MNQWSPNDILMRLQSFANVKLNPVNKNNVFPNGYTIRAVRETTLSFVSNLQDSKIKQLHYSSEARTEEESELPTNLDSSNGDGDDGGGDGNQNTDEEGVFISAAALAKLKEDQPKQGKQKTFVDRRSRLSI